MIVTPLLATRANAHVERWVGGCRQECLDVFFEAHSWLHRLNEARQNAGQRLPDNSMPLVVDDYASPLIRGGPGRCFPMRHVPRTGRRCPAGTGYPPPVTAWLAT